MALQRTAHRSLQLQRSVRFNNFRPTLATSRYYAKETHATAADGASDKTPQDAEPKILNTKHPTGKDQSEEVAEHNKNVEQRVEKLDGKGTEEDAKDDKVSKDFWRGTGGEGGM